MANARQLLNESGVQADVREFMETYSQTIGAAPSLEHVSEALSVLRMDMLHEETDELTDAVVGADLVEIADALADIVYIAYGNALTYGIDLNAVLREVHRSNMSKLGEDGKPVFRGDGKVIKGPNYSPPDVLGVLLDTKRLAEGRTL